MSEIDTLHKLLKRLSKILTPETDSFYGYALYTSDDDGGFLRTRWCWWDDKPVADHGIAPDLHTVLVTARTEIAETGLTTRESWEGLYECTTLKMQIHYDIWDAEFEDADWDRQLAYDYIYLINLDTGEVRMKYLETIT